MRQQLFEGAPGYLSTAAKEEASNLDYQQRLVEFSGGYLDPSAMFLTPGDVFDPFPVRDTFERLAVCRDIHRSLWDRDGVIADFYLRYGEGAAPVRGKRSPSQAFTLLDPTVNAAASTLKRYGILPFHYLTASGHHFTWRIPQDSRAYRWLVELGHVPTYLRNHYKSFQLAGLDGVPIESAKAHAGLSLVMEYLADEVMAAAAVNSAVPIRMAAPRETGADQPGENVLIDISAFADPLYRGSVGMPYCQDSNTSLWQAEEGQPCLVYRIPLQGMKVEEGLRIMDKPHEVMKLSEWLRAEIPDESVPMMTLLVDYTDSALEESHQWFYSLDQHGPGAWGATYDRGMAQIVPECCRRALESGPTLLQPAVLQNVVRVMLAMGWHPQHIAGLVRSRYERNASLGDRWSLGCAGAYAEFYVRAFTGNCVVGGDNLSDLSCWEANEKGICPSCECSADLEYYRDQLMSSSRFSLSGRPWGRGIAC